MNSLFQKYATRRNLSVLLILTVLFNVLFLLYFGDFEEPILDTYTYYSAGEAYEAIESYGEYDRQKYIRGTLMLDFIYPIIYCLMLAFAIYRLNGSGKIAAVPLWIIPVDYLENSLIIFLISKFPIRYEVLAGIAGIFTLTKWVMVVICLLGILVLFFSRVIIKKRETQ
ncbi:hypothetical protein [Lunatibacter salilacus]|uniref:hypothetical protein n=1 Tax=Lunatibacter salilacus TaxID=2483804 RepID=UPI00131CA42B|nr:hypothetical protein [Lunatibacter salilacus]